MANSNAFGRRRTKQAVGELSLKELFGKLHSIKIGGTSDDPLKMKIKRKHLATIMRNLATLLDNGLSLPKALNTLSKERSLQPFAKMLSTIRQSVEAGDAFSAAVAQYPRIFNSLIVHQLRVGERSGRVAETLSQLAGQLEQAGEVQKRIIKKLTYPAMVSTAGVGLVIFMLLVVVPQFQQIYEESGTPLPQITRFLLTASDILVGYGWVALVIGPALAFAYVKLRANPKSRAWMDGAILKVPVIGKWVRDLAVLQFMDALGIMMESGFVLLDAIKASIGAVGNQAVRSLVDELRLAVTRGERLSTELEKHSEVFPPTISQLVVVGEQTGNMSRATKGVRDHLRRRLEDKVDTAVGLIEPAVTLGLAIVIGVIVLAIYMPMFGMVNAVQ